MKIDVEVISREIIKPYTPTPDHLRHYQFSLLDQIYSTFHMPAMYFYDSVAHEKFSSHKEISGKLKVSLSKVLAHYYPLAGSIKDNYVDCNDAGVLFLEAQVDCQLSQIVHEPFARELNKFFPYNDLKQDGLKNSMLAIQINFYKCGTFGIGVLFSHKIADALSMVTFISNWAATARCGSPKFCPKFVSSTLFPPKDFSGLTISDYPPEESLVLKRFMFNASAVAALQEKYTDRTNLDHEIIHPTRVEALQSFIWHRFTASTQKEKGLQRPFMLIQPVNLRTKMDQPLPLDQSFGNMVDSAATVFSEITGQEDPHRYEVVRKLRDAKNKFNKDYVKRIQQGVFQIQDFGLLKNMKDIERLSNQEKEIGKFNFSSLCGFPFYETDFGWGRPLWVAISGMPHNNYAVLLDTKCGDGIEAWIQLKEEDMAKFETDKELLSFLNFPNLMQPKHSRLMAKY